MQVFKGLIVAAVVCAATVSAEADTSVLLRVQRVAALEPQAHHHHHHHREAVAAPAQPKAAAQPVVHHHHHHREVAPVAPVAPAQPVHHHHHHREAAPVAPAQPKAKKDVVVRVNKVAALQPKAQTQAQEPHHHHHHHKFSFGDVTNVIGNASHAVGNAIGKAKNKTVDYFNGSSDETEAHHHHHHHHHREAVPVAPAQPKAQAQEPHHHHHHKDAVNVNAAIDKLTAPKDAKPAAPVQGTSLSATKEDAPMGVTSIALVGSIVGALVGVVLVVAATMIQSRRAKHQAIEVDSAEEVATVEEAKEDAVDVEEERVVEDGAVEGKFEGSV